ncbi:hypothetical protein GOV13_03880 [Candidatus Pacearchaeota archaeon]|nr:hypothetical protein [Candidatus Pacearchaeota archaeon]
MFKKKDCKKCGKKISSKYDFCPSCGSSLKGKSRNEDFGMLGKNDFMAPANEFEQFTNSLLRGAGGKMFGKMFNSAMKMIEKEMQKSMKDSQDQPKTNMELFINGQRIPLNQPSQQINQNQVQKQIKKTPSLKLPQEKLKGFSKLPQQEPLTNVRRLSDRISYEIKIPGVKTVKDVSIVPLENSIEIKAVAKNKAYFKIIPIGLPIVNYQFSQGKIVLDLAAKN